MTVRSVEELVAAGAQVVEDYQQSQAVTMDVTPMPEVDRILAPMLWAEVREVVASDPEAGPHLVAQPVMFEGVPPLVVDAPMAAVRCYPSPNHTVAQYGVGETVKLVASRGGLIADKSA